ncbi:hypothetical protein [Botrimarina hoheduenensis]|uniref:Uncharacterized protein n=1 Tax=Botrimarina hoheduenensis TaxID=2528000 RepID=A0A5C5VWC4_9BACT|nr:hypothetical protein [Botrimarina hoheduenensis]TWT42918.1 hypothetical protein Pla111_25560 [Botrimarina hoheduenensis]
MDQPPASLDLTSEPPRAPRSTASPANFLGVTFECCGVYTRIYRNKNGDAYVGRCPRCLASLTVGIGPGGQSGRFYTAS